MFIEDPNFLKIIKSVKIYSCSPFLNIRLHMKYYHSIFIKIILVTCNMHVIHGQDLFSSLYTQERTQKLTDQEMDQEINWNLHEKKNEIEDIDAIAFRLAHHMEDLGV